MCDPAEIPFRRPVHAYERNICVATALQTTSGIQCFDVVLGTSFTVSLPEDPVSIWAGYGFVCWTDQEGRASCSDGASVPSLRVADVQRFDQRFSLLNDTLLVSQSGTPQLPFVFPTQTGSILATGPLAGCVVLPSSASSFSCQVSLSDNTLAPSSVTTNPAGFYGSAIADFRVNTTTMWWTNEAHSISWFGLPGCNGTVPYCSSQSTGDVGIFTLPPNLKATRVSPGFRQVCAVTLDKSLSCWGPATVSGWQTLSSVMDVFTYNGGGCAVFESFSSATCWGSFSQTLPLLFQKTCAPCTLTSSLVFNDACLPCGYGSESSISTVSQSAWCVGCPPLYVRGSTDSVCVACGEGFQPNVGFTSCTSCGSASYRSATMASCSECQAGSQSLPGGSSCTGCVLPLYRSLSMPSCSTCPSGSLPNALQTACLACDFPQYCSGTSMTFASCTCVACPEGTQVSGFGCASCTAPNIRLQPSQTCYACPEGTEPNSSFTLCLPCTGNFIRTNPSPYCFACPTRTKPNTSHTRCESISSGLTIDKMQYLFVGLGLLLLLMSWALSSFAPPWAATVGIVGVMCIAFGALWPVTIGKPNPS